jgi:hypothetical protein
VFQAKAVNLELFVGVGLAFVDVSVVPVENGVLAACHVGELPRDDHLLVPFEAQLGEFVGKRVRQCGGRLLEGGEETRELDELLAGELLEGVAVIAEGGHLHPEVVLLVHELDDLVHDAIDDDERAQLNRSCSLVEEHVVAVIIEELVVLILYSFVEALDLVGVDRQRFVQVARSDHAVVGPLDPVDFEVFVGVGIFVEEEQALGEVGVLGLLLDVHSFLLEVQRVLTIDADDLLLFVDIGAFVDRLQVSLGVI